MTVREECKWIGTQTLRLCDEFYSIARAVEFRHISDAHLSIKYAGETLEKFHTDGIFTDEQTKDFMSKLNDIREDLIWDRLPVASTKASRLADDTGWAMLNKLTECECRR